VLNYNTVPGETRKASDPSGVRLGSAAVTSPRFLCQRLPVPGLD